MSDITFYTRETMENVPYNKFFEIFSCDKWSLYHYVSLVIDNYKFAEKKKAHRTFFNTLDDINDNHGISQEVRNIAQNLVKRRK
ncbi:4357_t:CDS:1, partial [Funneliformis caledonium]